MTILEFCNKYSIGVPEAAGFKDAAKFYATNNFSEKLLILIYIKTFGVYPGGNDGLADIDLIAGEISNKLLTKINSEIQDRANGDLALEERIHTEELTREDEISRIEDLIASSVASGSDLLESLILDEASAREAGDLSLQNSKVDKSDVVNSDSSTSTVNPVSAYQVKLLRDEVIAILGVLNSTIADLDTMQEVVNFIQSNKTTLDEYATTKVSVSDIINDFLSDIPNKPASAHTVFVLNGLVDALESGKANKAGDTFTGAITIPVGTLSGHAVNKSQLDAKLDTADLTAFVEINSIPIGVPVPVWFETEAFCIVNKYPDYFVKLSADQVSSGQYNYAKLTGQTEQDSEETRFYTATISDALSPLNGKSITLINSVKNLTGGVSAQPAFLGAGETSQSRLVNRLQGHKINSHVSKNVGTENSEGGALKIYNALDGAQNETVLINGFIFTDGINGTPRFDKTNRPDTVTGVYYMRIRNFGV